MTEKNQTAHQKMQEIANRLISNTPQLLKILDSDSALRPKRPPSPFSKKGAPVQKSSHPYLSTSNKQDMTANDYHQKCKELTQELQTSRDKIFSLEEQITVIKQRFVEREIQYRKIIEELQQQIKSRTLLDGGDRNRMNQIGQLHKQILDNIGTIQHKTSKILIEQETDIRRFFHKKMNEMKDKFKEDKINKNEKDQEFVEKQKQMMSQLEWIKNIAHKIDLENQTLMKKYGTLKSEYEIQQKDKDLLMKELLMKKKQNAVLKSQVEQYEKLLNQVSKEMEQNQVKGSGIEDGEMILGESMKLQNNSAYKLPQGISNNKKDNQGKRVNTNMIDSRLSNSATKQNIQQKYESTIAHLKNMINKERRKVRQIKNLYMKEVGNKSDLEKIIRKLVDDVRQSIVQVDRQRARRRRNEDELSQQARQKLLEELLANEKVLTLIYDKTFYSGAKSPNFDRIPEQLDKILENNDEDGFY